MNIRYSYTANTSNTKPEWLLRGYTTAEVFSRLFPKDSFRIGNSVSRIGYSHPLVQDRTQNVIHKYFPLGYQNFYNQYTPSAYGGYGYSGYYNPYSLYGR